MTPEEEATRWPEHAKLKRVSSSEQRQAVGDFVEFLENKGIVLAKLDEQYGADYVRVLTPVSDLIAEYWGIDLKKFQDEKDSMLDYIRSLHTSNDDK